MCNFLSFLWPSQIKVSTMHINRARTFRALSKGWGEGRFTWLLTFAGCGHFWCFLNCALGVLRGARGRAGGSRKGMGSTTSLGAAWAAVGQPDHSHKCLLQNQWPPGCRGFCHAWSNGAGKEASVSSLNNISLHKICFQVICVCVFVFVFIPITYGTVDVA